MMLSKRVSFFFIPVVIVSITIWSGCKKHHPVPKNNSPTWHDTIVVLTDLAPATRLSFNPNYGYIDLTFISNIQESRCPNCLVTGPNHCPYEGVAYANFQVKAEGGDSSAFSPVFPSCVQFLDTSSQAVHRAAEWGPINGYSIWALGLMPYPTDSNYFGKYSMKLLIQTYY